jgi:hypothetical protein
MQLYDTFASNSVKTNTTTQKGTAIAVNATRDYKWGRSRAPSFLNLAWPRVECPGSSTVRFMPKNIASFTSSIWSLLGPRDDLGLLKKKQCHYRMVNQPSISADCNLATILTASSATTWKPVLCKVYRHNYNFLIVNHIMQSRRKFYLHYVIFLQSEQKLQVYLLTSQHNTMCQELLCNWDEYGST